MRADLLQVANWPLRGMLRWTAAVLLHQAQQEKRWADASGPEHREGYLASARAKARAAFALWRMTV